MFRNLYRIFHCVDFHEISLVAPLSEGIPYSHMVCVFKGYAKVVVAFSVENIGTPLKVGHKIKFLLKNTNHKKVSNIA